jgi:alkyl hydroperoxide reductase subunit D
VSALETLRAGIAEPAKDIKLNLQSVLQGGALTPAQRYGVAVASAIASRSPRLTRTLEQEAAAEVEPGVLDDARASAALMAMNNVYYRFRHQIGKESYSQKPARLRMNRMLQPSGSKADFELMSLAVSAINGCEACVRAHEAAVLSAGLSEDHVHDAVRIAATIHAAAVALEIGETIPREAAAAAHS